MNERKRRREYSEEGKRQESRDRKSTSETKGDREELLNLIRELTEKVDRTNTRTKEDRYKEGHHRREERRPDGVRGMTCFGCGEEGHRKAECPKGTKQVACVWCRKVGHEVGECSARKAYTCPLCGEKGHGKSFCTPQHCTKCGQEHARKNGCGRG